MKTDKFIEKTFQLMRSSSFNYDKFIDDIEEYFEKNGFREADDNKNILVIRTDAIGDFILTSPVLRELRKNYPDSHITLVCNPLVYDLAEKCPYIDEILSCDGTSQERISSI